MVCLAHVIHVLKRSYCSLIGVTPPHTPPDSPCHCLPPTWICHCCHVISSSLHLFVVCLTLFSHQTVGHFIVPFIHHLITRTTTVPGLWSGFRTNLLYEWPSLVILLLLLFSRPVVSDSLQPHGLQHTRPPCPSPSPEVCPSLCPLHQWCHPTILSSDALFYFCPQSFPESGAFPMSQLFAPRDQNSGVSTLTSVLPMSFQGWFPLRLTGLISLLSKGLSEVFSSTIVQRHQFFSARPSLLLFYRSHYQGLMRCMRPGARVAEPSVWQNRESHPVTGLSRLTIFISECDGSCYLYSGISHLIKTCFVLFLSCFLCGSCLHN